MAYALDDRTTFRAGVGRFLNRVQINTTAAYGFNPPLSEMQTVINGVVDAPGGAVTRNFPLVMATQSPDFTNPTSWAWNATLDRELPWQMRGTLSYVGRSASHLERARNINQMRTGTVQANPGVNANALRPYLGFGSITLYETTGTSRYNSLQTQVEHRSARGFGFSVAYTFSRNKDDASGRGDILPDTYDDSHFYSISDLDRPHVLVSSMRYRFPSLDGSVAPMRWVLGTGTSPASSRRSPARPSPSARPTAIRNLSMCLFFVQFVLVRRADGERRAGLRLEDARDIPVPEHPAQRRRR